LPLARARPGGSVDFDGLPGFPGAPGLPGLPPWPGCARASAALAGLPDDYWGVAWRRLSGIHAGSEDAPRAVFLGFFSMHAWYTAQSGCRPTGGAGPPF
jgi:hypothetical protein